MPAKADPEKQQTFLESTLKPLIEKAKKDLEPLYFLDASHFVMGGSPGRVWSVVRRWVKTACGRKRFNVLGALNFVTKKVETVVNDTYITSSEIIAMLEKLARIHIGQTINVILDNAKYQRCNVVIEKAKALGINLCFLPTYSPNLNLIERVWKLVKSRVLNAAYTETFDDFQKKISSCIDSLHTSLLMEMSSLITEKFHIIITASSSA
jgi:transposase